MVYLILILTTLLVIYVIRACRRPSRYPPGPTWLPVVGNIPEIKKLSKQLGGQHFAYQELAKQYKSNVIGLKFGSEYVVSVTSYPVVKEILTREVFEGRPDNFFMRLRSMGMRKGITGVDGDFWRIQRNFVTTHLRYLGYGKDTMKTMIKDEISELIALIKSNPENLNLAKMLAPAVINIIWALTSGSRIQRSDPRLSRLLEIFDLRSKTFSMAGSTLCHHPWLRFIMPEKIGYNLILKLNEELDMLIKESITEHKNTWKEGECSDLIYSFLTEMDKHKNNADTTFTEDQLVMVCLDLIIAGAQTTSNTLGFIFLIMILRPDIQDKIYECLSKEFDKNEEIDYSNRHKVPYIEAVIMEVERYFYVVPIIGPRRVLHDTVLNGYTLPKDTTVVINIHSVHHDKEYWKDPEVFRPDRFLDSEGKILLNERLLPFGLGRRRCLGDLLARNCIFMFFTEILRHFKIELMTDKKPSMVPVPGLTLSPEFYLAKCTGRA